MVAVGEGEKDGFDGPVDTAQDSVADFTDVLGVSYAGAATAGAEPPALGDGPLAVCDDPPDADLDFPATADDPPDAD